jgi:hypothetical protein
MEEKTTNGARDVGDDKAHQLLIERANKDYAKRIKEKQKRFGQVHDTEEDLAERARVATANRNALITLMGEHKIMIPARELPLWRPTVRATGDIDGVQEAITIVATNGILGWYLTPDEQAWCGHIQCFTGEIVTLFRTEKEKSMKPRRPKRQKSRRQQILDSL